VASGVQLVCIGILGVYLASVYVEVKARPRYIIKEYTKIDAWSSASGALSSARRS